MSAEGLPVGEPRWRNCANSLSVECAAREQRTREAMLKLATLPAIKTLEGYDFSFDSGRPAQAAHRARGLAVRCLSPSGTAFRDKKAQKTGAGASSTFTSVVTSTAHPAKVRSPGADGDAGSRLRMPTRCATARLHRTDAQ